MLLFLLLNLPALIKSFHLHNERDNAFRKIRNKNNNAEFILEMGTKNLECEAGVGVVKVSFRGLLGINKNHGNLWWG